MIVLDDEDSFLFTWTAGASNFFGGLCTDFDWALEVWDWKSLESYTLGIDKY